MTSRTCPHCGTALAADAHPRTKYCSAGCRYRHRDQQPARLAADAERHRLRYARDPDHRRRRNAARTENYRKARRKDQP